MSDSCSHCHYLVEMCTCSEHRSCIAREDALKAEVERLKAELDRTNEIALDVMRNRDRWRGIAKQAVERLRSVRDCLDKGEMISRMKLEEVFSIYDEAAKPKTESCKYQSGQVFCNDPFCGNRDSDGSHWPMNNPNNKGYKAAKP